MLKLAEASLGEISAIVENGEQDQEIESCYEQVCGLIKKLELSVDKTKDEMLDADVSLEQIMEWANSQKINLRRFRDMRSKLKQLLVEIQIKEDEKALTKEVEKQRAINEETVRARVNEQKEIEAVAIRQIEREEDWLRRKLQIEKEAREQTKESHSPATTTQAVKLQKYTITPFTGDFKDWMRFWNQFSVEVDGSSISEISKFNYLLELTKGKPREDILGLPHTNEGYTEAKRILLSTYGKDIKVHKALIKEIESLHAITSIHKTASIHEFYNKLSRVVRTLSTMKKLDSAQSTVYTLMDKLGPVREILAQSDDKWEEWKLEELTENLRKYVERNPLHTGEEEKRNNNLRDRSREKLLMGNGQQNRKINMGCVYCGNENHKSSNCVKYLSVASRREILKRNRLCYNCTGKGHTASSCRSRNCTKCGQKHHTSLCEERKSTMGADQSKSTTENLSKSSTEKVGLSASSSSTTTLHPTVKAKVNGHEVRIMIDTGASTSYVCSDLVTKLSLRPVRREEKCIEQMYGTVTKRVDIYRLHIQSTVVDNFGLDVDCINAEKGVLTYLPNPKVKVLKEQSRRLKQLQFCEEETTDKYLPVHVILGAADYQRIRSTEQPILGENPDKDPGAEFTMLGWVLYGKSVSNNSPEEKGFFLNSSQSEFERLCSVDVLGLVEPPENESKFHEDFSEHLHQTEGGFYETQLPWKPDHPKLPVNRELTAARLRSTTRRLEKVGKLAEYHMVMEEQLQERILEPVPLKPTGEVVHYIPHQPVIREEAESTKLRIVYDCSAKQVPQLPSLNDCLETGPALQPLLFDILLRNRMRSHCVTGDIKKAFLQIRIDEQDRDAQRTLWYNNLTDMHIVEYRFTRVIFGAAPSPYILGATLQKHVKQFQTEYPETTKALLEDTYVDDVQSGGDSVGELEKFKEEATTIMKKGGFTLHKWHSDVAALESKSDQNVKDDQNQEMVTRPIEESSKTTKILGVPWDKSTDVLHVDFEPCLRTALPLTKRKILAAINGVYDILGWASPVTITGKILFSELCLHKISWDEQVSDDIEQRWNMWAKGLRDCRRITIPRSVVNRKKEQLSLHGFADASKLAVCAAVYVQAAYSSGKTSQNLLVSKARVAPKNVSIPRLELVAAHTLAKLISHVNRTLSSYDIWRNHLWSDSTTVLHWLANRGTWSKYVRNRVKAIQDLGDFTWRYVPTDQNPSDLGTRGVAPKKLGDFWLKGPEWLADRSVWPSQPEITETEEASSEALSKKKEKVLLEQDGGVSNNRKEWANTMLRKHNYWKILRITAFMMRFVHNCQQNVKRKGPLTTEEIAAAENRWLKIAQEDGEMQCTFELKKDNLELWRCHGRVTGYHPVFIPRKHPLAKLIIERCHEETLHGGVQATMCKVRERYWIPQLRRMSKSVRFECNRCKKLRAKALPSPTTSALPTFRTEFTDPFSTTGVDFAGPMYYKTQKKEIGKAYVVLFTCASTRAVHLRLCKDLTTNEFKRSLKEFVARRGLPKQMVSDNAKTFVAAKKWLETLQSDDEINNYVADKSIQWKFNLSRAPWWGGFFERLIGIMKSALSKVIGKAMLTFAELEETLLDVECFMNNRPLVYLGEEIEGRAVTPNILLRGEPVTFLEENIETLGDEADVTRRIKYLKRCREQLRKRWINEYLHALDEKQKRTSNGNESKLETGRVVLIKDSLKNSAQWRIGRIEGKIFGKDGVVRGYKVRTGNGYLVERPAQLVADLEIGGESTNTNTCRKATKLNPDAKEFLPRVTVRKAKETARNRMVGIALNELEED